jgi:hypothetical protein
MGPKLLYTITMERKKMRTLEYTLALTISIIIFLLGAMLGSTINDAKLASITTLEQDLRVTSLSTELLIELIDDCEDINNSVYTEEISEIGARLTYMESIIGFKSSEVKNLKSYYSLLLIRHWLINEKLQTVCESAKEDVFFFYSNFIPCADCEDQGNVLTYVHDEENTFNVYSFEFQEENQAVEFIKKKYNIEAHTLPVLVINDTPYYGFQSKETLQELLGN